MMKTFVQRDLMKLQIGLWSDCKVTLTRKRTRLWKTSNSPRVSVDRIVSQPFASYGNPGTNVTDSPQLTLRKKRIANNIKGKYFSLTFV